MFEITNTKTIAKDKKKYLSFPDIIQSPINPNKLFIVYREGDGHHPYSSALIVLESTNKGRTWKQTHKFKSSLKKHNKVWNCPRLSYTDENSKSFLNIVCDAKNGTSERIATFSTTRFISDNDGKSFSANPLPFIGMVPDKIIKFKDKYLCANHKIKAPNNSLIQLVNWNKIGSKDAWYNCNVVANSTTKQYCEASIVNVNNEYLIAYLRDNSGHFNKIDYTKSKDGITWDKPKSLNGVWGQRVTAIKDENMILGTYRNTIDARVSLFYHHIGKEKEVKVFDIDQEYKNNLYHFGYTGIAQTSPNTFIVVYYIMNNEDWPFIKIAYIKKT